MIKICFYCNKKIIKEVFMENDKSFCSIDHKTLFFKNEVSNYLKKKTSSCNIFNCYYGIQIKGFYARRVYRK